MREGFVTRGLWMSDLARQLNDYRMTLAEITYHLPDHPGLLQTFLWQDLDIAPAFPVLRKFLDFWGHNLDGKLHSVRISDVKLIQPGRYCHGSEFLIQ